jgi:hypothetical protein
MGHPVIVMRRIRQSQTRHCDTANYDRRVGNPFACTRKFSGKTATTRRQMLNKKGADKRPFRIS